MTTENGSITVVASVPVLGTVSGTRKAADIAAGTAPQLGTDAPAVVTRPLDKSKLSAAPRPAPVTVAAAGNDPGPVAAATKTPAPPATKTPKPAPAAGDAEARAAKLLQLAETYLRAGMKPQGAAKLKELLAKYPGSKAAEKAETLLRKR